ncbi:hypothetical protein [Akkermansia glycaniphila]|uniref:Major capsid protein n=1 Tax=Akkermansia glycaniphila TaxID=1679444 RepID=A0A1C7PFN7_9BACT|nr:hypothetical protein [Akkermansia glycaniphila]OCA02315.1 hypothetical protein AC781_10815 [Akkermansia glycaniphila]OCA04199.1 hypothetical protein AC781_00455 [Akkermansia glycaniphila]SEH87578.1 Hypothetical protein PYTT_1382 [Akkermansia glycaniphila]
MSTTTEFCYPLYDRAVNYFKIPVFNVLEFLAARWAGNIGGMGTYKSWPQGYVWRPVETERGLHEVAKTINTGSVDLPFMLQDHSIRIGVDDKELKRNPGKTADQIANAKLGTLLGTWRTSQTAQGLQALRDNVPALSGIGNWSNASSKPLTELKDLISDYRNNHGVEPNRIIFSHQAWDILSENPSILPRIQYNSTQTLTPERLYELLGLDAATGTKIHRVTVPVGTAAPGPNVQTTGANMLGSDVMLTFIDDQSQYDDLCGMAILYGGDSGPVEVPIKYRSDAEHTWWYEIGMSRQFVFPAIGLNNRITVS